MSKKVYKKLEDTEDSIHFNYFSSEKTLQAIVDAAKEKWPHQNLSDLKIFPERVRVFGNPGDPEEPFDFDLYITVTNTKYCGYCHSGDPEASCGKCHCGEKGHLRGFGPGTFLTCEKCYKKMVEDYDKECDSFDDE